MRLHGLQRLRRFAKRHPDARTSLWAWVAEVEDASWQKMIDIKERYPKASVINASRVVFDIRGNQYRLDVKIAFPSQVVLVVRIGNHDDYRHWEFPK